MFWIFLFAFGIAYILQVILGSLQLKNFAKHYAQLRRQGKVAIGKRKNALSAGAIVMFLLDENGVIKESRGMSGLTVLARFKKLKGLDGLHICDLARENLRLLPKGLRLAVFNARDNYLLVQEGKTPTEPAGPWTRVAEKMQAWRSKKKVTKPYNQTI